jgi:hypothetical protein
MIFVRSSWTEEEGVTYLSSKLHKHALVLTACAAPIMTSCRNTEDRVYRANTPRDVYEKMEEGANRGHNPCDTRKSTSASACSKVRSVMDTALCGRKTLRTFDETLPLFHVLCDLHPLSSLQKVNLATNPIRLLLHPCLGKQALTKLGDLH